MKHGKILFALGLLMCACGFSGLSFAAEATGTGQTITRAGSQASVQGSADYFTGAVRVDPLFSPKHTEAPFSAAYVTFEAGARSNWHIHPAGQHLVVVKGVGLTGTVDGPVREFREGDVVWCPKGVKHWHGASPDSTMTHMAITGALPGGGSVEWLEPVTDEQYLGRK